MNLKKQYEGTVVSNKMSKVSVVKVDTLVPHPLYKKRIVRSKKYFVRDEENKCKVGDSVSFVHSKPYSKKTCYILKKIY